MNQSTKTRNRYYIFNSYLYTNLQKEDIGKWTSGTDIFSFPYLIIPIFLKNHWTVFITHLTDDKTIIEYSFYDSMSENTTPIKAGNKTTSPDRITDNITNYLKSEWNKLGKTGDFPKPSRIYYKDGAYKIVKRYVQKNDYECGICTLHFIDCFIRGASDIRLEDKLKLVFSKDGANHFNRRVANEVRPAYRDIVERYYYNTNSNKKPSHTSSTPITPFVVTAEKQRNTISNPSATHCYSNSVLQALLSNTELVNSLRNLLLPAAEENSFINQFLELGKQLSSSTAAATLDISPLRKSVFSLPRFRKFHSSEQQDPHEYLSLLFEELDSQIATVIGLQNIGTEKNPLFDHFGFEISHTYKCNQCQSSSGDKDIYKILTLVNFEEKATNSILDLVQQYFSNDTGIKWRCRNRCNFSSAACVTELLRCPRNPIIYLTHPTLFTFDKKLPGKIQPLQLTHSIPLGNVKLDITGIVRHTGSSPNSGHYTVTVKKDNTWDYFSDSVHRRVSLSLPLHY